MLFPRKIAEGSAFCNRELVRAKLTKNIKKVEHTVIVSPRRYGKTSLALKVINDMKIPFAHVDFFLALDSNTITERLLSGAASLINMITPINIKATSAIKEFFKSFNISLSIGPSSVGIKFEPPRKSTERIILETLEGLDDLLQKKRKQAVFFIDEMQDIINLPICSEIEFALRSFAQKSKNISFIFSGSNRKLLKALFDDKSRPLWKLCDRINLQRIDASYYKDFLNNAAQKKWKTKLTDSVFNEVITLTECHSYYINYLCSEIWEQKKPPSTNDVMLTWLSICKLEQQSAAGILSDLSDNQKRILIYIANQNTWSQPTSGKSTSDLKITPRGILQALKGLEDKDLIEPIIHNLKKGYRVLDPMMKQILLNLSTVN